jgi:hypothetical protein
MSKENSKYTIGNRARDLPACSTVVKKGYCKVMQSTFVIYYIVVSFKFWCKLPEVGVNDADTCCCTHEGIWELCVEYAVAESQEGVIHRSRCFRGGGEGCKIS